MSNPNVIEFYHHPLHYQITPVLPAFWRFERTDLEAVIHITGPNLDWVTVDFKTRGFTLGARFSAPKNSKRYKGQGWWQELVNDAVKVLKQTENK